VTFADHACVCWLVIQQYIVALFKLNIVKKQDRQTFLKAKYYPQVVAVASVGTDSNKVAPSIANDSS